MGSSAAGQQLLFLLLVLGGSLLLVVRPARARAEALLQVRASLEVGREVIPTAGLCAPEVGRQDDVVVLGTGPGVHARSAAGAVVRVLDRPAPSPGR